MTPELTALTLCGLLQFVQYALFLIPANLELGTGYTSSPRDRPPSRQLSLRTARLQRAFTNHFEALILFTLAVAGGIAAAGIAVSLRGARRELGQPCPAPTGHTFAEMLTGRVQPRYLHVHLLLE